MDKKADKTQAVPETLKDFQALMDFNTIMNAGAFALGEIASDGYYITEAAWLSATSDIAKNAFTWVRTVPYNRVISWERTYSRIFYNNLVLEGIERMPGSVDRAERANVKGQALFNRSEAFLFLAQLYAPPYNPSTIDSVIGLPLRLNADITEPTVRTTLKQTYQQIVNDLKLAEEILPVRAAYVTRGSKAAVYGLLSRVYLIMQEYDSAYDYSNKYLQIYSDLLDFNQLPGAANFIGIFNKEVSFHVTMLTSGLANFLTTNYFINQDLYNSYEANDLRKTIFFRLNANGTIIFKGNYNRNATELFSGLATSEIYLIRAECNARIGRTAEAMKDLNDLLRTRWKKDASGQTTYIDQTAASANEALGLILAERRKELILRGLRWSDLRRLNQEERFKVTLTRSIGGQTYTLEPNSYKYTFPIPDDIIEISGMSQNPGWD